MSKSFVIQGALTYKGEERFIGAEKKHREMEIAIKFESYKTKSGEPRYSEPTFSVITWDGTQEKYDKIKQLKQLQLGETIQVEFEVEGKRVQKKDGSGVWAQNVLSLKSFGVVESDGSVNVSQKKEKPTAGQVKDDYSKKFMEEVKSPDTDDLPF